MTTTELTENLRSIIDGYDRSFADRIAELPKETKTERKALHIQRGMCNVVKRACLRVYSADPAKNLAMHRNMIDRLRLPISENDRRCLSALEGDGRDAATVYLSAVTFAKVYFIAPYEKELPVAEADGNDDAVFELTIKLKTLEAILNDIRQWWAEHGCADFEA